MKTLITGIDGFVGKILALHLKKQIFIDTLLEGVKEDRILLEKIDEGRWKKAWQMSKKFSDKPNISFTDFSSFVLMSELGVSEALTADRHFEDIGLGFKKLF